MKKEKKFTFLSLSNSYFNQINKWIDLLIQYNPFTRLYGVARSLLALGTLSIFVFNDMSYIFDEFLLTSMYHSSFIYSKINLFVLLGWDNLFYGKIIAIIILISVLTGYLPQITCFLHWWIAFSLQTGASILDGGDQINAILTAFLIPIALLDNRKNHWFIGKKSASEFKKIVAHFAFFFISLQMSFLYFHAAVEKIYATDHWTNGTAMYYILKDPTFGLSNTNYNLFKSFLENNSVVFFTWSIIILELFISYNLMTKRNNRMLSFVIGFVFHFLIAYFFGLISFAFSMIAGLCLFTLPFSFFENLNLPKILKKLIR